MSDVISKNVTYYYFHICAKTHKPGRASLVHQLVKSLPAVWEIWVQSLGWEDPLEKGRATHSSILTWSIPWIEVPGGLQSMGHKKLDTTEQLTHIIKYKIFQHISSL